MKTAYYDIEDNTVRTLPSCDYERNGGNAIIHVCDIGVSKREEAVEVLQSMMVDTKNSAFSPGSLQAYIIRVYGCFVYGELAYFSSNASDPLRYLGVIQNENSIIFVHEEGEAVIEEFFKSLPKLAKYSLNQLGIPFLLFVLIREILSANGKLIISYREEVEEIDKDFDEKYSSIDPAEFKAFKTHLSDFNRAIEKQYYSLSFPPTKSLVNKNSPYTLYFKELTNTLDILKESLDQTEKRLDSLHDHYDLVLQNRSNKRLNFLTIIQAVFVPLTLLTGIYGMNWAYMPELNYRYGYFILLGVMVVVALIFVRYFYKHGWFD